MTDVPIKSHCCVQSSHGCLSPTTASSPSGEGYPGESRPMKYSKPILLILASIFLSACAVAETATQKITALTEGLEPETFYTGVAGLKLYWDPRFTDKYTVRLLLNEKLVRYEVRNGFAYVKVARTGQTGWVKNGHLVRKKAGSREAAHKKATPKGDSPKGVGPKKDLAKKSPPKEEPIKEPSQPNPEIERTGASSFDSF